MRNLALGIIAAIGLSTAAQAADMAVKARPFVAPVAIYDWSGIYIGGSVGWEQDRFNWAFAPPIPGALHQNYSFENSGGNAGIHGGIQKQFGQFVLGAEIGYMGSWNRTATELMFGNNPALNSQSRIRDGVFEAGVRGGFAVNNWLFYGTGGYAGATIDSQATQVGTGLPFFAASNWHDGGYAGVGVEYAFASNWIVGAEYQHVWLDTKRHCGSLGVCLGAAGAFVDRDVRADLDVFRVRLSYKFNPWAGAVVAKY